MTDLDELKKDVAKKFQEMRAALHMREKLLLRQIDVIEQQMGRANTASTALDCGREIRFEADQEAVLLASIRTFGRFQLDNMNLALQDVYLQHEDYIAPSNDHETMYKCLLQNSAIADDGCTHHNHNNNNNGNDTMATAIVVDFSKNKSLIEHNAKNMNESIINITLQEAKELIKKAKVKRETIIPPLNLEELDDEFESSIAEAVSSLAQDVPPPLSSSSGAKPKASKKSRFKPKITINNCNGTINLRNIASLTINCASEEAVSADIPIGGGGDEDDGDDVVTSSQCTKKTNKKAKSTKTSSSTTTTSSAATVIESSTPTPTSSNYSSSASSRSQSKKQSKKQQQPPPPPPHSKSISLSKSLTTIAKPKSASHPYEFVVNDDDDAYGDDDEEDVADNDANSEEIVPTCDFYNRLLNEIKNSLREKPRRSYELPSQTVATSSTYDSYESRGDDTETTTGAPPPNRARTQDTGVTSTSTSAVATSTSASSSLAGDGQPGKRLVLKNFENLKIILEANSGDEETFHPVQIEQWLAEIITEADLEPMQNTEILEHSKIHNETL